jgi:hypothetical protein
MKFNENDCVKTLRDFPDQGIFKGEIGTVVIVFTTPNEAYEIEFDDGNGHPRATFPILPEDICKWGGTVI